MSVDRNSVTRAQEEAHAPTLVEDQLRRLNEAFERILREEFSCFQRGEIPDRLIAVLSSLYLTVHGERRERELAWMTDVFIHVLTEYRFQGGIMSAALQQSVERVQGLLADPFEADGLFQRMMIADYGDVAGPLSGSVEPNFRLIPALAPLPEDLQRIMNGDLVLHPEIPLTDVCNTRNELEAPVPPARAERLVVSTPTWRPGRGRLRNEV